jgi:Domain of unknown function (DUF4126)
MIEILAVLSASSAAGMRIALPLLVIGLLHGPDLWNQIPLISAVPPPVLLGVLVSWSLFELLASKKLLGQRVLQVVQLVLGPIVGGMLGVAVATWMNVASDLIWVMGGIGGLSALVLQLVQMGWFYQLRGLPLWVIFAEDILCVGLVLLALDAPRQGGLIALILLWLAIRSTSEWRSRYLANKRRSTTNSQSESHPPD